MPLLDAVAPLLARPMRVLVAGTPGASKTTVARRAILTDREHMIRCAWAAHHKTATRVAALLEEHPDLVVVRLTRRSDVERWLAGSLQRTAPRR